MDISEKISKGCISFIADNLEKTEEDLEKIEYGLQVFFVNLFKLAVLFSAASFLGVVKQTFIAFVSFAFLRLFASGVHADSNIKCTITNLMLFLGNVYLSSNISLKRPVMLAIFAVSLILLSLYAPADTEDRPLLSLRLRKKLKLESVAAALILGVIALTAKSNVTTNLIVFSMLEEALMITPAIYHVFNRKYRNYKSIDIK